ncbi:glutamine-synthetase adenylyltransferase [Primorskyibacter flagellatus]|uniref:[protein-PII] uridylyltransferase family protein n=1 Tax=Primorskyibacter flagellatus TaxID=1387277 RepID=UPI003A8D49FE
MSFANRITRCPIPFEPDRGTDALALTPWAKGDVARLIEGTAGCSPYLAGLIGKETDWLQGALDDAEGVAGAEIARLNEMAPDVLPVELRRAKRRIALLTALADLGGVWPLETVTGTLTDLADTACATALRATVGAEIRRGKLPGQGEDDIATAGGMTVLAMGKMGAGELNYSSDIDLICLFDETRYEPDDFHDARSSLVRATRKMAAMLNDLTGDGYVFRTDLRLRPDPSVTPVCIAMEAAERYYESLGRTWERAAYIKARPCAGDIEAGNRFLEVLTPFVWRKHLDFAAIQDAHDMRLRIREHKGLGRAIRLEDHNMKLGRGGIREIEFFTQTRQIIAGGRDPDLRVRGTVPGLSVLSDKGWLPRDTSDKLAAHYRSHREVEHRVQMIQDAQTHLLPSSAEGMSRLAAFMGMDEAEMRRELTDRLTEVHELTEGFFAPDSDRGESYQTQFENEAEITAAWPRYPALRSGRAMSIFKRLRPEIMARLAKSGRPDEALAAFDGFLKGLPAGVQLFSLFDANPQLIDLLVDIVGTAPALARHLSRNSGVFDAVIGGDFFSVWPGKAALVRELRDHLAREDDYERKLDATRRWGKEWHFRIGVHLLRGLSDAEEAALQYADLAEASLSGLYPDVVAQFAAKHGDPPGRGAMVLGMGSMGAARLHPTSDLDVIVIYDADGVENSDGRRPLNARSYYARLTQALITAVTASTAEGRLYEMDMRLRPSGKQGPVATSLDSFKAYQREDAWIWEHLALTRARALAGPAELCQDVEALRREVLSSPPSQEVVLAELAKMRARIASAKSKVSDWDAKIGAGRLQDIELVSQAGALLAGKGQRRVREGLSGAANSGWLTAKDVVTLREAYALCWSLQLASRLLSEAPLDVYDLGAGAGTFLMRLTEADTIAGLRDKLDTLTGAAARIIDEALPMVDEKERRDDEG